MSWQGDEAQKTLYRKYFTQIDRVLRPYFADHSEPLVVAGVDYLLPIFREASSYRHLVPQGIPGNPEELTEAMRAELTVLASLVGASGLTLDLAVLYLSIIIPSLPLLIVGMVGGAILRAHGAARKAMLVTITGGVINAVLDPILRCA